MTLSAEAIRPLILIAHPPDQGWDALGQALTTAGYAVDTVTEATALLPTVQQRLPDGILLRLHWPDTDGYTLCQGLQEHPQIQAIPVIVLGGMSDKAACLRAFELGAVDYILEPFWVEEVVARLRAPVANYRLQQRLLAQTQRVMSRGYPNAGILTDLQKALRRQTQVLHEQNEQLQREVHEREEAEAALRREQQKSEKLLLNILPRAIVEQLKQLQGSLAERFEDVTILFADIVNFTPLAAQISPLELVSWLNQIFSEFDRLAEKFHLEKIKTIGDAYMVVGGLPLPQADHAEAVMEMAIAMQAAAQRFTRQDGQEFQLRIGINTGTVVAGVIGIKKFSYDLWGDAVNIANRMATQGTPGRIQITEETYQRLRSHYTFEPSGQILVKGRGYMMTYQYVDRK